MISLKRCHSRLSEEEVKIKDLDIIEKKKKLREAKVKLKQQQMLYEATRSDRNLYSKQLIEAQDTIAEYKRKFNILNHQIDQLKEEIVVKEQAIFTEHMTHMRVQKEYAAKQGQLAVLENHVQPDGTIYVPKALRNYLGNRERLEG